VVELGRNEFDRPVTTVVIDWEVAPRERKVKKSPGLQLLEEIIAAQTAEQGNGGGIRRPSEDEVREAFRKAYRVKKPNVDGETIRKAFKRALEQGQTLSSIGSDGTHLWLAEEPASNF
jgi:hypothetical protein